MQLFLHFDANKSTDIEREEVMQLLHVFNEYPSDEKFERIYNHLDMNVSPAPIILLLPMSTLTP